MRARSLVPFLSTLILACSSAEEADDGSAEAELQGACTLGETCSPTIKLLSAKSFLTSRPAANRRSDVSVPNMQPGMDLRVFNRATSRTFETDGTKKISLAGNAAGDAPIHVDDFFLVEVLSPNGELLSAGAANVTGARVANTDAKLLAPIPAQTGPNLGWAYAAGTVDLTALLPKNTPFRLRVSAFDLTGAALSSDVYLKVEDGGDVTPPPPPPPPPPATIDDPFDPASCNGPAATVADFAPRFAAGGRLAFLGKYKVVTRTRDCNGITGCAPWQPNTAAIDMSQNRDDRAPPNADPLTGSLWLEISNGKVYPKFVNAHCWSKTQASPHGQVCEAPPESQAQLEGAVGPGLYGWKCWDLTSQPGNVRCGGYSYVSSIRWMGSQNGLQPVDRILRGWQYGVPNDPAANMPYATAYIGKSCARATARLVSENRSTHDRSEVEVAALARY